MPQAFDLKACAKDVPAVQVAALVQNPELLRVTTISAKIIDQLDLEADFETWSEVEVIGAVGKYKNILAKDKNSNRLRYISGLQFVTLVEDELVREGCATASANAEAHKALNALPQVFKV